MVLDPDKIKVGPKASVFVVITALVMGAASALFAILAMISFQDSPTIPPGANSSIELSCHFQTDAASMFAVISALLLSAAMMFLSILGGCVCCITMIYAYGQALRVSIVCYTLAWASYFVAEACLMSGAFINEYSTGTTFYMYDIQIIQCYQPTSTSYLIGAITAVTTVLFGILYYGQAQKSKYEAWVEQGAPTPRLYSKETMKSFVIAGPAKKGPLREDEEEYDDLDDDYDAFDENAPLNPGGRDQRPNYNDDQSTYRDEQSSFRDDRSSVHDDKMSYRDDGTSFRDDDTSYRDDRTSMRDDRASMRDDHTSSRDDRSSIPGR